MELNYFKDQLFDLLNDSENMQIADIELNDKDSIFTITTEDEDVFEIECRKVTS